MSSAALFHARARVRRAIGVTVGLICMLAGTAVVAPITGDAVAATRTLKFCTGKVKLVQDGDTVTVKLLTGCPGGTKGSSMVIRNAGIQATEVHDNECWSAEARQQFRHYMPVGTKVRLASYGATVADRETNRNEVRYLKFMYVKRNHKWFDLQAAQLRSGLAMWKPQDVENANDAKYATLQQQAIRSQRGMWGAPDHCGPNQPTAQLQAWINWKTDGSDRAANANDEFFALRNVGVTQINLGGWAVRDASHLFGSQSSTGAGSDSQTYFVFPSGTKLSAGDTLRLFPGAGTDDVAGLKFYAHKNALPFWRNVGKATAPRTFLGPDQAAPGAEAFLVDPNKDFRAEAQYPCVVGCTAPTVAIANVQPLHTDESLVLRNTSATTAADLTGAVLDYDGLIKQFKPGTLIAPGSSVTVHIAQGDQPDSATDIYWPQPGKDHILRDAGGAIWMRTWDDVTIDFAKWGDGGTYSY